MRKATLLIGQGPAVLCQTFSGLRELALGRPTCAHAIFIQRQSTFPGHALRCVARLPSEGMEQREEQCAKPLFSNQESPHSARRGLRAEASVWKVCAFQSGRSVFSTTRCVFALLLCIVLATSCGHRPQLSRIESFKYFHLLNHFGYLPRHPELSALGCGSI